MVPPPTPPNEDSADAESNEERATDHDRGTDGPAADARTEVVGIGVVAVACALVIGQFLGWGVIDDSTLRLLLGAGIVLVGGREVIRSIAEAIA